MLILIVQEVYYLFKKVYRMSATILILSWEAKIDWQGNFAVIAYYQWTRFIIISHWGSIELGGLIRTVHYLHAFWNQRMPLYGMKPALLNSDYSD